MKLKNQIAIDATPDKVWECVGSPEVWSLFHSKAGKCQHVSGQSDSLGAQYDIEFRMGSRVSMTRCEIVEYRVGRLIVLTSTLPTPDRHGRVASARITYELEDLGRRTRVLEEVEFDSSAIPWIFRPLVWLLTRFGKPTGETTLQRLKRLVEQDG